MLILAFIIRLLNTVKMVEIYSCGSTVTPPNCGLPTLQQLLKSNIKYVSGSDYEYDCVQVGLEVPLSMCQLFCFGGIMKVIHVVVGGTTPNGKSG